MARKTIPQDTQTRILTKSRRRCCLCFWLDGRDEVQKGQIAHLDGDNENASEENLVFLCFDHHDDLDGTTRLAKGLQPDEVRQWRDELYKEMEYRFRTVQKRELELTVQEPVFSVNAGSGEVQVEEGFGLRFCLTNTGESTVRTPIVSISIPPRVAADWRKTVPLGFGQEIVLPYQGSVAEIHDDLFEPDGRVAQIQPLDGLNPVLIPGHSVTFDGLVFRFEDFIDKKEIRLQYRIGAEDMIPVVGELIYTLPDSVLVLVSRGSRPPFAT